MLVNTMWKDYAGEMKIWTLYRCLRLKKMYPCLITQKLEVAPNDRHLLIVLCIDVDRIPEILCKNLKSMQYLVLCFLDF